MRLGSDEGGVIIRDKDSDSKSSQDVEEEDTPEDSTDGFGDVATRVFCLTGCDCHHFDTTV